MSLYSLQEFDTIATLEPGKSAPRYEALRFYSATLAIDTPELDDVENRILTLSPLLSPVQISRFLSHFAEDSSARALSLNHRHITQLQHGIRDQAEATTLPHMITKAFESGWLSTRKPTRAAFPLSGKQPEVLKLVAEGLTAPEIAEQIDSTPLGINHHEKSIMRRLRVPNMMAAVLVYKLLEGNADAASSRPPLDYDVRIT